MNKNIILIGGTSEFKDTELAHSQIDKILKTKKIPKKDLLVYGYEDSSKAIGAYAVAEAWATKAKAKFANGNPKSGKDWGQMMAERNSAMASNCVLLINLRVGNKNGGKGILEAFELKNIPVEVIDESPYEPSGAKEESNAVSDADLSPKALRKGIVPDKKDVERSVKVYSKVAQKLLNYGCLMLDTETTGLKETDEVIEIAILDCASGVSVFNSLIHSDVESSPFAFEVNKITPEMLKGQPTIADVWLQIEAIVGNRVVLASNAPFDERLLNQSLRKHDLTCSFIWKDIQTLYRNYSCQGNASQYRLKTVGMCKQLGVEAGTHRAKDDVEAQIRLLKAMADGVIPDFEV